MGEIFGGVVCGGWWEGVVDIVGEIGGIVELERYGFGVEDVDCFCLG